MVIIIVQSTPGTPGITPLLISLFSFSTFTNYKLKLRFLSIAISFHSFFSLVFLYFLFYSTLCHLFILQISFDDVPYNQTKDVSLNPLKNAQNYLRDV